MSRSTNPRMGGSTAATRPGSARGRVVASGLGLFCLVGWLGAACHRESPPESKGALPEARVRVAKVESGRRRATEEVMGTVRSRTRAMLEAKVSGRIEKMHAVPGRTVEAGALLAELEVREIRAKVEQAQAVARQADRDYERMAGLFRQEAVTRAELDAVEARRSVARASVVEAEAMMEYARIVAPFAGVVTRKLLDVGDLATPGRPLLELEDPKALRFEADVPAGLVEWVRPGEELAVTIGSGAEPVRAVVGEVEPSADPVSRTFRVRLDLPASAEAKGGWFGRMVLPLQEVGVTTVSTQAISSRGAMEYVWVAEGGKARLRIVKTGRRLGPSFEVLSGLEPGEAVVVEGGGSLVDGQPVATP
ncbi:MAG: efflux RND transporter periplasmic adaptor subunit [Verrucomicrobiales bacterium]|nr:efflux RND transporter periplasmic adaptor subunit [Verrucomicrobiales bacterium]